MAAADSHADLVGPAGHLRALLPYDLAVSFGPDVRVFSFTFGLSRRVE